MTNTDRERNIREHQLLSAGKSYRNWNQGLAQLLNGPYDISSPSDVEIINPQAVTLVKARLKVLTGLIGDGICRVCSLGAGTGRELRDFVRQFERDANLRGTAVGLSDPRGYLDRGYDNMHRIQYQVMDIDDWLEQQKDDSLGVVLMQALLHCVHDPLGTMSRVYSKLMPGGTAFFNILASNAVFREPLNWQQYMEMINAQAGSQILFGVETSIIGGDGYEEVYGRIEVPLEKSQLDWRPGLHEFPYYCMSLNNNPVPLMGYTI